VLEQPDPHCTPDIMHEILSNLHDTLLRNVSIYKAPSQDSLEKVKRGEPIQLHADWVDFVQQLSEATDLDAVQASEFLSKFAKEQPAAALRAQDIALDEVVDFYYYERSCLLRCISAILRIRLSDANHIYFPAASKCLDKLITDGLEKEILQRYNERCTVTMPKTTAMEKFEVSTRWADQIVQEQALLLEILFMLYYSVCAPGYAKVVQTARIIQTQKFGRQQPLYTYLSDKGRKTVEWIGHLCTLIMLEVLQLEELMRIWDTPLDDPNFKKNSQEIFSSHPLLQDEE